eukprot:Gregarina_sp_Pseudo_9__299@NODE_1193_length_1795_cov_10_693052_g1119_i0_p1_GENE_NODE_1193_length_1795_cov_10_693052_g1119_i0NODE_1193_length_1795_cov_10_693052_g1119_i0_p1_ORF_typecomplete_len559_score25_16_NODE_1193_length_1795_cov_10_693052_g1119_i0851761
MGWRPDELCKMENIKQSLDTPVIACNLVATDQVSRVARKIIGALTVREIISELGILVEDGSLTFKASLVLLYRIIWHGRDDSFSTLALEISQLTDSQDLAFRDFTDDRPLGEHFDSEPLPDSFWTIPDSAKDDLLRVLKSRSSRDAFRGIHYYLIFFPDKLDTETALYLVAGLHTFGTQWASQILLADDELKVKAIQGQNCEELEKLKFTQNRPGQNVSILKLLCPFLSLRQRYRMSQVCHAIRQFILSPKWEEEAMEQTIAMSAVRVISDWSLLVKCEPPEMPQYIFDSESIPTCLEKWVTALRSWHALGTFLLTQYSPPPSSTGYSNIFDQWNIVLHFLLAEAHIPKFHLYYATGKPNVPLTDTDWNSPVYITRSFRALTKDSFMKQFWRGLSDALHRIPDRLRARGAMLELLSDPGWRRRAINYKDRSCPPLAFYMAIWTDAKSYRVEPNNMNFLADLAKCLQLFHPGLRKWKPRAIKSDKDLCSDLIADLRTLFAESAQLIPDPLFSVDKDLFFSYKIWHQVQLEHEPDEEYDLTSSPMVFYGRETGQIVWFTK